MAPPELGQPKAPDKGDAKSSNLDNTNEPVPSTSSNAKATSVSVLQQDSKPIRGMEEDELKALLEEAITYKGPRDREHKSATFNELLHKTELEDQQQNYSFCTRSSKSSRVSGRHGGHGGSLQDLQEALQNEYYYAEHGYKKHHSRQKKHTTSVSSRQREGGSLPCNVNESTSATASFLNEVPKRNNKSKNKTDYGTMHVVSMSSTADGSADGNCDGKKDESQVVDCGKVIRQTETIIDIEESESDETQHLLAHDSLSQTICDPLSVEEGTELIGGVMKRIPRVNMHQYTAQINIPAGSDSKNSDIGGPSTTVRPTVQFDKISTISLLENSSKNVEVTPVQLGSSYNAVKCIVDSKPDESSHAKTHNQSHSMFLGPAGKYITGPGLIPGLTTTNFSHILQNRMDENGNPVTTSAYNSMPSTSSASTQPNSKSKNRKPKSDRNTVNVDLENIEGYRGKDTDIDSLVCYIENKDKAPKNGTVLKMGGQSGNGAGQKANNISDNKKKNNNTNNGNNNESGKNKNKKLKKCNSLEELSSVSRNKDIIKDDVDEVNNVETVTLRKPAVKNSNSTTTKSNTNNTITIGTDNVTVTVNAKLPNANKRGERRSWGTEELNYLGENGIVEKEKEPNNNNSCSNNNNSSNSNTGSGNVGGSCNKEKIKIKDVSIMNASISTEKKDSLSIVSIENISTGSAETAEFHVVTKKKKAKKKLSQNPFGDDQMQSNNSNNNQNSIQSNYNNGKNENNHMHNRRNGNNFGRKNDRDLYMNANNEPLYCGGGGGQHSSNNNSRRKSTSSMPPSEKSDSSDLDSVHSLPVENCSSSSSTSNKVVLPLPPPPPPVTAVTTNKPSTISYADIARNAAVDKIEKWPSVVTITNSNSGNNDSQNSASMRTVKSSFPELVDHHQNNNNNKTNSLSLNNSNNNVNKESVNNIISLGNSNMVNSNSVLMKDITYSQSLLAENENNSQTIINNNIIIISNSDKKSTKQLSNSELNNNVSVVNNKLALHKSKSVDNTELNYSIEQYPALEATICHHNKNQPLVNVNNNNSNIVITNSVSTVIAPLVVAGKIVNNTTSNTNNNTTMPVQNLTTNQTSTKKIKTKKDQPQSSLETINNLRNIITDTIDTLNNNNQVIVDQQPMEYQPITQPPPPLPMQTPNLQVHNHSPSGSSEPASLPLQQYQQSTPKVNQSNVQSHPSNVTVKRSKRDRHSLPNSVSSHHSFASNRPAVIILNDSEPKSHEFTFGFDIDQELLFGDFQEDEITMLDSNHVDIQSINTSTQSDLGYNSLNSNNNQTEIYDHQNRTMMIIGKSTEFIDLLSTTLSGDRCECLESMIVQQQQQPTGEECGGEMFNNTINPNNNNINVSLPTQPQVDQPPPQTTVIPVPIIKEQLRELTVRYIQPTSLEIANFNHEKIVNFVGLAWEDIARRSDGGVKYYDGQ